MKITSIKQAILFLGSLCLLMACKSHETELKIAKTACNNFENPLGVDTQQPVFSWKISSSEPENFQKAYHILVSDQPYLLKNDSANIWNTGRVSSDQSINIKFKGSDLESGKTYYWKVKVWDTNGNESAWSDINSWQMGLLNAKAWDGAQWIGYENMPQEKRVVEGLAGYGAISENKVLERDEVPMLRRSFSLEDNVESATLYISGIGQYEASINGEKIGDDFLTPGWSHYDKTVFYNAYDISDHLIIGENAIGVLLGNGFSYINRERYRKLVIAYGYPKMICKLEVQLSNEKSINIVSDTNWEVKPSPITFSSIYGGEDYDATLEEKGWNTADFDAGSWQQAKVVTPPYGALKADPNHPVRVMQVFDAESVKQLNDSVYIYDFGQNASGTVSINVKGDKGSKIQLRPGEVLSADGFVNQRGSGSPYLLHYTLNGDGEESWHPRFTYYGFRYVQVTGARPTGEKGEIELPELLNIKALHTRNSAPQVGSFACSNELFNKTFDLINWAIKSNTQSLSTDCPTREKLGWIEQTYLMGGSVHFNFDVHHLYTTLMRNMEDAQMKTGLVPNIVPEYINFNYYDSDFSDSPEWGIASVIIPWQIYKWYADSSVMKQAWPLMVKYMDYLKSKASENILSHGLGDWYDLGPEPPGFAQLTPVPLVATASYYHAAKHMALMAEVLKKEEEANKYHSLADDIKVAFNVQFYNAETKVYATGSQTAMAMPLSMGLVPENDKQAVFENLKKQIEADGKRVTAGDIGFHYLIDALTKFGAAELLYTINNRDDVPGYGYQIKKGATSLAESWQALHSKSMNHLMLGHLMEWFYKGLGGIGQENQSAGYKSLVIKPEVIDSITYVKTSYESPYGLIKSEWEQDEQTFSLTVDVPFNTNARIVLPFDGKVTVSHPEGVSEPTRAGNGQEYKTGSGVYSFAIKKQ